MNAQRVFLSFWILDTMVSLNPNFVFIMADSLSIQHQQKLFHVRFSVQKNYETFSKMSVV